MLGCKKPFGQDEANPDPNPAAKATATAAPASTQASASLDEPANAGDVKRFSDEKKLGAVKAKLEWSSSKIHAQPQGDVIVTSLPKGVEVEKLAEHGGWFLVQFKDPKDGSRSLLGWVYRDAFKASAPGTDCDFNNPAGFCVAPNLACPKGQTHFNMEDDYCAKRCASDDECPGQHCSSEPHTIIVNGQPNGRARHCEKDD